MTLTSVSQLSDASFVSFIVECVREENVKKLRALYYLRLLIAPFVETLILADRSAYLR